MQKTFLVGLLCAGALAAETDFSGVWKANLEKSKMGGGPPISSYLAIVGQQDGKLTETVGVWNQRGEERRATYKYDLTGAKPSMNTLRGAPMQTKVSWEGATLVLDSQVAGMRPMKTHETWSLEGSVLTVNSTNTVRGQNMTAMLVLEKQPDSAAEPLRKPEKTAGQEFKNVKVLQDLPASQFLDAMGSFTVALGKGCEFCHVRGKDELDDKKEKLTARKMIEMTHNINAQNFNGKMEVRCYTCHQGHNEPMSHPTFGE
jgi:hypothetical protein